MSNPIVNFSKNILVKIIINLIHDTLRLQKEYFRNIETICHINIIFCKILLLKSIVIIFFERTVMINYFEFIRDKNEFIIYSDGLIKL